MGSIIENLGIVHEGTTALDNQVRLGLVLATGMAEMFAIAATVQPPEVALGGSFVVGTATAIEAFHQLENLGIRCGWASPPGRDEASKLRDAKARSEFEEG